MWPPKQTATCGSRGREGEGGASGSPFYGIFHNGCALNVRAVTTYQAVNSKYNSVKGGRGKKSSECCGSLKHCLRIGGGGKDCEPFQPPDSQQPLRDTCLPAGPFVASPINSGASISHIRDTQWKVGLQKWPANSPEPSAAPRLSSPQSLMTRLAALLLGKNANLTPSVV